MEGGGINNENKKRKQLFTNDDQTVTLQIIKIAQENHFQTAILKIDCFMFKLIFKHGGELSVFGQLLNKHCRPKLCISSFNFFFITLWGRKIIF